MLTFGSLFAGIGGIDLGLERAGLVCKWQVEKDDYATRVLEKHWPHVQHFRDARECGAHNLAWTDLIAGGFPCQPHSTAGKRLGAVDERDLWPEFRRIIGELRPRWVLAENVPGLLSSDNGRFFGGILGDLATLGYDAEWECIPAAAVGAPHIRDRVYIVAYTQCDRREQGTEILCPWQSIVATSSEDVANSPSIRSRQLPAREWTAQTNPDRCSENVPYAERYGLEKPRVFEPAHQSFERYWPAEPDVGRMAHGVPARVDRLRGLGNAVVPQVAEIVGRYVVAHARMRGLL